MSGHDPLSEKGLQGGLTLEPEEKEVFAKGDMSFSTSVGGECERLRYPPSSDMGILKRSPVIEAS